MQKEIQTNATAKLLNYKCHFLIVYVKLVMIREKASKEKLTKSRKYAKFCRP